MSAVALLGSFLAMFSSKSRSFGGGHAYKPVNRDEFDMDAVGTIGNDDSLNDFLDEADYDSAPPNIYGATADERRSDRRPREEDNRPVPGGAKAAREPVPKLSAPGASTAQRFDIGGDEDLL
jgi:hypothetical protein